MALLSKLTVRFDAQTGAFITDMKRAAKQTKSTGTQMKNVLAAAGTAVAAGFAISAKKAAEFETAMAEVSTLVDTSVTDMNELKQSVLDVSREMGGNAKENASALYQIISAGAEAGAESTALLTAANKLAVGGVTDVATAADGLTTVMNAYGMETHEAAQTTDIMFATMKAGKTTIGELSAAYGTVVTLAATAGVSFEELSAATASLTKVGLTTSQSMTALQGVLAAVAKGSQQSLKMAKELGIEFSISAIKSKGFANFLGEVQEKSGGSAEKLSKLFGRVEGLTAVLALGANGGEEFYTVLEDIQRATGATDEAFLKMSQTAEFQFNKLKALFETIVIQIGEKFLPAINDTLEAMIALFNFIGDESTLQKQKNLYAEATASVEGYTEAVKDLTDKQEAQIQIERRLTQIMDIEGQVRALNEKANAWYRTGIVEDNYRQRAALLVERQQELYDQVVELREGLEKLPEPIQEVTDEVEELGGAAGDAKKPLEEITVEAERLAGVSMPRDLQDWFSDFTRKIDPALAKAQDFAFAQNKINEMIAADPENREMYISWLERYHQKLNEVKEDTTGPTGYIAVMEQAWQSLDSTFQSMWDNFFETGKISLDGIKDLFISTLAQMAHQAFTRPIVMQLGASMGLPGSGPLGPNNLIGGGGGLTSILGQLAMPLGIGAAIGEGGSTAEQWGSLGGSLIGTSALGWGIGALAQVSTGFATLLGGIGTQALNFIIPVIGPIVGALLGKAIGKMLTRDPEVTFQGSNFAPIEESSLFGGFDVRARGGTGPQEDPDSFAGQAIAAIRDFDDALGAIMSDSQIERIVEAMKGWRVNLKNSAVTIENVLTSRFKVVLSTFNQYAQDYVAGFDGLEDQVQALSKWVATWNAMREVLKTYVTSSLPDLLNTTADARTSGQMLSDMASELRGLFETFDGTPETMERIGTLIAQRYEGEIRYITAIDNLIQQIGTSTMRAKDRVKEIFGQGSTSKSGAELLAEARKLQRQINLASSPEEIASLFQRAQELAVQAAQAFKDGGGLGSVSGYNQVLGLLTALENSATSRANTLREMAVEEAEQLRLDAAMFAEDNNLRLDEIVLATQDTTAAVNDQTVVIDEGNAAIRDQLITVNESLAVLANEVRGKSDRDVIREELRPVS